MTFVESILLALALCIDSLVVSTTSAFKSKMSYRRGLLMAIIFATCQTLCPLLGAVVGNVARAFIEAVDHWVAFGLLAAVGGKMIYDALRNSDNGSCLDVKRVGIMFLLGIATSIDSLAVGIGLGLDMEMASVVKVVLTIGVCTFAASMLGVLLGKRNIPVPERTASFIAGVVLIGLGVHILLEHLGLIG